MSVISKFSLDGRVAVITGGSEGIGRGIALAFAEQGANIVVASRTKEKLDVVCAEVQALGRQALAVPTDVTDPNDIENLIGAAHKQFGRIDILVNNAGGPSGSTFSRGPLLDLTMQDFRGSIDMNLTSVFLASTCAARIMMEQETGGSILNIGSMAGRGHGWGPVHIMAVYGAAKAAVMHLTESMSIQWAPKIRVNCINPGHVSTPTVDTTRGGAEGIERRRLTIGMERFGQPEDIAAAALYLASDAGGWVTGTVLDVYGGDKVTNQLPGSSRPRTN
jgi:7-alpha-hydroxysteroid dehydrogenase